MTPKTLNDVRVLDVHEVARLLECSEETVRRAARAGKITPIQRPGQKAYLFDLEEIVSLPRGNNWYTAIAAYKKIHENGMAPAYKSAEVKRRFIRKLIKEGRLYAVQSKLSKFWLVEDRSLDAYISKKRSGRYIPPLPKPEKLNTKQNS